MQWIVKKIVGTKRDRDLKRLRPFVARINALEQEYQNLSEEALRAKTAEFKDRLANGQALDDVMCEAFAAVKNACRRLLGTKYEVCSREVIWDMVPFDVQLIGGIALHQGKIAEMATGEGKTLVATMPLYLNALTGLGAHLVTTNDFLARRDAQWMGLVYGYLGISVGCIQNHMLPAERREHYSRDITYGTNSEFGFDYLRDHGMATTPDELVQRGYVYAIVDEVDSILVDEARTPLIISGTVPGNTSDIGHIYIELKPKVERLVRLQRDICNELIAKAKQHLEKGEGEDAELYLYQIHHGMPKHKQFMHMIEESSSRRLLEHVESIMLTDMRKEQAHALREELYFVIDEKGHDAHLTDKGCEALNPTDPDAYVLPDLVSLTSELEADSSLSPEERTQKRIEMQNAFTSRSERIHCVDQLIRAYCMYEKDVQYVVQDNQVLIVDEFTGRILPGRRWADGLHQAVEAKEGTKIERETQTLATITIQNYFRLYKKLAGMTGTAETEASEFRQIYNLDVLGIPTNRPVRRVDCHDQIYRTQREKYKAIIEDISNCHAKGQPVLVGTISVDASELLSRMLRRAQIPHNVLNAKQHEKESEIVARAGQQGSVTIATNMAGRGTDIKLGEGVVYLDRKVIESGMPLDEKVDGKSLRDMLAANPCGLYVIGTERHEARRIDRQLRGRCARQGDPGGSRFYVSLEDDLMRLFGSDRIAGVLNRLGLEEGQVLEHRWLNKSIENAQKRVEQQNFSIRKRTLEYDDVMNKQREVVYGLRGEIVKSSNVRERLYDLVWDAINSKASETLGGRSEEGAERFVDWIQSAFPVAVRKEEVADKFEGPDDATDMIFDRVKTAYELKVKTEDPDSVKDMERYIVLHSIDSHWQDYLRSIDYLREGVGLRAYGQRDPLVEYKREAFDMFETLMGDIKSDVAAKIFRTTTNLQSFSRFLSALPQNLIHDEVSILGRGAGAPRPPRQDYEQSGGEAVPALEAGIPVRRDAPKVGRNDPCPCGSGKKYKKCCAAA